MQARYGLLWASALLMAALALSPLSIEAQQPPAPAGGGAGRGAARGGGGGGAAAAYPTRTPAPADVVERGKSIYSVNCQFCHGADIRGGDQGPSLLRSQVVQDDQNGELIAQVVREGRPPRMPKFNFNDQQVADVAAFIHSFELNSRDPARNRPQTVVTGDAVAGQQFFSAKCSSCHTTAQMQATMKRVPDPRNFQQWWLLPGGGGRGRGVAAPNTDVPPVTATITPRVGPKVEGRLVRIDEFSVSVIDANGLTRTFQRNGETPFVEVHDPLKPHKDMLRTITDKNIHDVTAYLVKMP